MDFNTLSAECAPSVHPITMAAVVHVESGFNPFAIGVVGGQLERQPNSLAEATATAQALERDGWNFSVGVAQINRYQLRAHGLDYTTAFDPCASLRAGAQILTDCYSRAYSKYGDEQQALRASFSCYYSGNFQRGFADEGGGKGSYVGRILSNARSKDRAGPGSATAIAAQVRN